MTKWNIICDSSCDILSLDGMSKDTRFGIAPLKILLGEETFVDDETLDIKKMMAAMSQNKGVSSSSCPSPFEWLEQFERAENTIAITISSELSGSYNSAIVAKGMLLEKCPTSKIHIINSKSVSGTMILLAKKANQLISAGLSFEEIVNELDQYNNTMQLTFCLENYSTLIKNGRMHPLVGAVAAALNIRAVAIKSSKGDIQVISKQRGAQNTYKYMVTQMMEKKQLSNLPIYINHCNNAEGAHMIKNLLKELGGCVDVTILDTRALCSYYANNGGIIVSY
ncbi:MAG: DegV family protein [Oscillospiraceae bacterium]